MDILFLEPFYSGSHKSWLKGLTKHSSHRITTLGLRGHYWKWRMHGAAYTLAEIFKKTDLPQMILASDMLDLGNFLALTRRHIPPRLPVGLYFHENQLEYPWQEESEDVRRGRDLHYGFINYNSALAADFLLFNSRWNRDSFLTRLEGLLKRMPDKRHKGSTAHLRARSHIMPIGMDLCALSAKDPVYIAPEPLIIWNHRLEHDKGPVEFFELLLSLKEEGLSFTLALMAEITPLTPPAVRNMIEALGERVLRLGMLSPREYSSWLRAGSILPVTSHHDFFGISIAEALYCGAHPLLPARLTYPELYDIKTNPHFFYHSLEELHEKLRGLLANPSTITRGCAAHLAEPYDWPRLAPQGDALLSKIYEEQVGLYS